MSYQDDNYRDNPSASQDDRDRYDDRYQDDRDRDDRLRTDPTGQPPKKGCSKGCLYAGAGCGCLTVLMIAVIGVLGWKVADYVMKRSSDDPAVIRAGTLEMAEMQIPANLEPKMKIDIYFVKVILYQSKDGKSRLSLVQTHPQFAEQAKQQQFGKEFRKIDDGDPEARKQELTIVKFETRELKIRGQTSKVKFSEAKDSNDEEYRVVEGEFPGKAGPVEFALQEPADEYDEAEVTKFLESIK